MSWPTPQEYNEAIQNPRTAFADPELKAGQPVLTPLGLPRPITGGFASVYQIACPNQRTYAVRCFLREFRDYQERYAAISAHLATTRLPYMVNFAFLTEGIRVGGQWYPILKMEWIDGETLHAYIERNLRQTQKLRNLADQWERMTRDLDQAMIAHGDLQHGNVLVVNDQLRLIDYDGMFVPGLERRQSHEIGHRNYQHPDRSESYFAPGMDNFSARVVYTSLKALAAEPKLWVDFRGGDECLILRREDFVKPEASPVLDRLKAGPDAQVIKLADELRKMLKLPPDQVPPINHAAANWGADGGWVEEYRNGAALRPPLLTALRPRRAPAPSPTPSHALPEWLPDHLPGDKPGPDPIDFASDVRSPRLVASGALLLIVATWWVAAGIGLSVTGPAAVTMLTLLAAVGVLLGGYSRDPNVAQLWRAQDGVRRMRRQLRQAHKRMRSVEQEDVRITVNHHTRAAQIDRKSAQLLVEEQREQQRLNARLQARLASLVQREQELRQREIAEVAAAEQRYAGKIAAHDTQLRQLSQAETTELGATLARRQQQFLATFLARQPIGDASIPGIGPAITQRLQEQGIRYAADIELRRLAAISGIGEGRAQVLIEWRLHVEQQARRAAPQRLSVLDETLIRAKYFGRRIGAEREVTRARQQQQRQIEEIRQRHDARRKAQGGRKQEIHAAHQGSVDALHRRTVQKEQKLQQERRQAQTAATAERQRVRSRRSEVEQEQDRLVAELRQFERTLAQLDHLDFGRYVRRILNL